MLYLNKKKRPQKPCSSSEPLIQLDPYCIVSFVCLLVFLPVANQSREAFRELQDREKALRQHLALVEIRIIVLFCRIDCGVYKRQNDCYTGVRTNRQN